MDAFGKKTLPSPKMPIRCDILGKVNGIGRRSWRHNGMEICIVTSQSLLLITSIVKVIFKMDLWLNPSRSNEPTSKCDFCYQTGVPVKSLSCGSHFYCGVCEKFAPKFYKRADYTCSRCPGPRRSQRQSLDLDLSPTTLNVRPVKKRQDFKEVTIAVEGGNILSFGGKLLAVKFQIFWAWLIKRFVLHVIVVTWWRRSFKVFKQLLMF